MIPLLYGIFQGWEAKMPSYLTRKPKVIKHKLGMRVSVHQNFFLTLVLS